MTLCRLQRFLAILMTLVAALLPVAGARAELRTSTSPRNDAAALPSSTSLDRLTSSVALTVVSAAGDNVSELTLLATVGGHFGPAPQGYVSSRFKANRSAKLT